MLHMMFKVVRVLLACFSTETKEVIAAEKKSKRELGLGATDVK